MPIKGLAHGHGGIARSRASATDGDKMKDLPSTLAEVELPSVNRPSKYAHRCLAMVPWTQMRSPPWLSVAACQKCMKPVSCVAADGSWRYDRPSDQDLLPSARWPTFQRIAERMQLDGAIAGYCGCWLGGIELMYAGSPRRANVHPTSASTTRAGYHQLRGYLPITDWIASIPPAPQPSVIPVIL
jgi:hypothetical protein